MAEKGLTESEVLEIVYKSDKSFSDSSNDSASNSDNKIDDIAVADAVINDDNSDEEEILHQDYMWENTSDIVEYFEFFF
jgi:hypothetical protein